jgi:phi13 family phage major tail protein
MATIGLRDVHYAKMLTDTSAGATYNAPIKIRGAISANVNPNSSSSTLFADDGPYDSAATLGEISLELNLADIPPAISAALLGHTYQNGMLTKRSSDVPPYVAIGYRSLKSNGHYRYTWLYKGKFTDGETANATKGDSIEYQTPTITGAFVKRDYDDAWQTEADSDDTNISPATISDWFTSVVAPILTAKTLTSIDITTAPSKVAYSVGDIFDVTGMVVTATYSDTTTEFVTAFCTYTPAGALVAGDTSVTIAYAYGGVTKTDTQAITVT